MRRIASQTKSQKSRSQGRVRWLCSLGCMGLVVAAGVGLIRMEAQASFPLPAMNPPGAKAAAPGAQTAAAPAAQSTPQNAGAAGANASTPEVTQQCADLLKMATDLKSAVDKSSAGTLSVTVVRKAGEIEQLAHKVRNASAKN